MSRIPYLLLLLALLVWAGCASGKAAVAPPAAAGSARTQVQTDRPAPYKPYREVITDEAVSDRGLFTTHRMGEKLYYEIPDSLLGREMLLVSRIAQTPADLSPYISSGSKVGEQVLRWQRKGDRVLLRKRSYRSVAGDSLPVARSVASNNFEPIVAAFDIAALGEGSASVVLDVTDLYTEDVPALSGLSGDQRSRFRVRRLDTERTFIDTVRSFPRNVDVRHTLTFEAGAPPSDAETGTLSLQMHQSMVLLPARPMRPRLADPRVGYFTISQVDFGLDEQKAAERRYIRRWRLEPSDPEAYARGELVAPVKPIVFYLDPATPEQWRPYFKQGVEDWNRAFEAAGFKNAILARDPPSPEEDPEFSPEDVRYSTIRYVANETRNAIGPSVTDPRSGEIIESDIIWYHNHMRSYRNRLMIETGAANPQARSLKLDESLIGETMRQVIAHEVGHALGLPHNMIASASFPVDSLRSPRFTERYGVAPSIMDYARQNYIAQPGDGVARFVRKIGPYDAYAVAWGYRLFPEAATPEAEKPLLDSLILLRAGDARYRYAPRRGSTVDPRAQIEDLGDDPVRAGTYAVANLQRVVPQLVAWTTAPGTDYSDLEEIYGELLSQWRRYMGHVVPLVGGVYEDTKTSDQEGPVFRPVSRERQREAVRFLAEHVFETPLWLQNEALLRRIEAAGAVHRIGRMQVGILEDLLDPERMQRLVEDEVFRPAEAYRLLDFLGDVKRGVWYELEQGEAVDAYRRNLQRGHLAHLVSLLEARAEGSDVRPFVRGQLAELRVEAEQAARRTEDAATRYHLQDVAARIEAVLEHPG